LEIGVVNVLGALFLTDVKLLGRGLALGESITTPVRQYSPYTCLQFPLGQTHPPAEPVGLDEPEPVAPSAMRRAAKEK
jgi:hypothetical protein